MKEYMKKYRQKHRKKILKQMREYGRKKRNSLTHCIICNGILSEGPREFIKFCSSECKDINGQRWRKKYYKKRMLEEDFRKKKRTLNKQYNKQLRKQVLIHYGGSPLKCACCDEDHVEFLSIDHIAGGGAKHRKIIGSSRIYRWLKRNGYPEGFQVLCYNCNHVKRNYNKPFCPVHHPELY